MNTVAEILKASGFSDEDIAKLDARAMTAFSGVLTTAEQAKSAAIEAAAKAENDRQAAIKAREAAELAQRSNTEFYETKIIPGLTGWEEEQKRLLTEKANAEALAAFYKTQNEAARSGGFVPADAPAFAAPAAPAQPARSATGQYVAGAPGSTPGSPTFTMEQVREGLGGTMGVLADIQWKHQQLYGRPMPMSPTELTRQAENLRLDPVSFAERQFNFSARERELAEQAKQEHEKTLRAEEAARVAAEYEAKLKAQADEFAAKERTRAEQGGNNPDVRQAPVSPKFTEIKRAVAEGTRQDPLKMTDAQRRAATRQSIHEEIGSNLAVA